MLSSISHTPLMGYFILLGPWFNGLHTSLWKTAFHPIEHIPLFHSIPPFQSSDCQPYFFCTVKVGLLARAWGSMHYFSCACTSENLFMDMADHLAADGFKDMGYQYVNIDVSSVWKDFTRVLTRREVVHGDSWGLKVTVWCIINCSYRHLRLYISPFPNIIGNQWFIGNHFMFLTLSLSHPS